MEIPENPLKKGDRGDAVRELQQSLKTAGYKVGAVDGVFGGGTEKAVLAFQADHELYDDGLAGAHFVQTLNAYLDSDMVKLTQRLLKRGVSGEDVGLLQTRLLELGYEPGDIDGIFGPKTRAAVVEFQGAYGLAADGVVGKDTVSTLVSAVEMGGDDFTMEDEEGGEV